MSGSGPKASNTSWRCWSESLSSVSSSWLRTNVAHWASCGISGLRERLREGAGVPAGQRQIEVLHADEVELEGQLVAVGGAAPEVQPLLRVRQVDLAHEDRVPHPPGQER